MAIWGSVRFSVRILGKHWKFTSIAVFSLAMAMAAGAVGFSVFNTLLLRPPAVVAPDRLLTVYSATPADEYSGVCYDDYQFYRDKNRVFSGLMAFPYSITVNPIVYRQRTKAGLINAVSDTYFSVLGVQPFLGRVFTRGDDDQPSTLAVLSYSYWKWLGADPQIVGQTVTVNNVRLTVIGVLPKNFVGTIFSDAPDVWYPLSTDLSANHHGLEWRNDRSVRSLRMVGRLKPGIAREQALANLQFMSRQLARAFPQTNKDRLARIADTRMLPEDAVSPARVISALVFVIVGLVIFAACSNVANLLLALANARRHEILVRAAMGATRSRLIGGVLFDSTLIAIGGGTLGFLLASLGLRELLQFKPYFPGLGPLPLTIDFRPDFTVLAVTVALMLVVGLATGIVPGLYASTPNLAAALSGEIAIGGTRKGRVRNSLVVIQVAVCTLVFVAVGLCFRSLSNLRHVSLGFNARNIAILTADLQPLAPTEAQGRTLYGQVREAALRAPGVEAVSLASDVPVSQNEGSVEQVRLENSSTANATSQNIAFAVVDENYFSTLRLPILTGRAFTAADTPHGPPVIVVNHLLAEKYWPGQNAIGKTVEVANGNRTATVIGVAADSKYVDVDEPPRPFIYFDLNQNYQPAVYLLARTHAAPRAWLGPLSDALQKTDPRLIALSLTFEDWMDFTLFVPRITLICITGFGALAFLLAAVGLYGAVFYSVSERKKELGIRVALGAGPRDLWGMILRQTSFVTATGVVLGILGGIVSSILVRSLLFGIHPVEWVVFLGVTLLMGAMTVLTAYSAARPWIHRDPLESVRHA